jgi:hypothetical protein
MRIYPFDHSSVTDISDSELVVNSVCATGFRQRSGAILWRDVSDFRVAPVPPSGHRLVPFDWHAAPNSRVRRINTHLIDATDGLPDSYGLRPEELADVLNTWRSRATFDR